MRKGCHSHNIRIARIKLGLRQIDVARRLKVSPSLVSYWEAGLSVPSPALQRRLAAILKADNLFSAEIPKHMGTQE